MNSSDTSLRKCSTCKFAVNQWEWKRCRNTECPHEFSTLVPGENMPAPTQKEAPSLSVMDRRIYIHNQGHVCPFCFNTNTEVDGHTEQVTETKIAQPMRCTKGHEWHEIYTLTSVVTNQEYDIAYPPEDEQQPTNNDQREPDHVQAE